MNREHAILLNIQEAESRAEEAKAELLIAQEKLKQAKQKAFVIHKNGEVTAQLEDERYGEQAIEYIDRLYKVKEETIEFQRQQVIKEISRKMIKSAFEQVYKKLENRSDSAFQKAVNNFYLNLFKNYKT